MDTARRRPIVDTHIHLYTVTAEGGVAWPAPHQKAIYRDVVPAEYAKVAERNGITGAVVVEASPKLDENFRLLDLVAGDPLYLGLVGNVEIGASDFLENVDRLRKHARFVGIRSFLSSPTLTVDETQVAHLEALAARGLTLDIISRHTLNPKDKVDQLCKAVPTLRVVVDHLAGAQGPRVDPTWERSMGMLARNQNLFIKFSSFFDVYNPKTTEDEPWQAPTNLAAYKPHFDALMQSFGPERLLFGGDWPAVDFGRRHRDGNRARRGVLGHARGRRARQGDVPQCPEAMASPPPVVVRRNG